MRQVPIATKPISIQYFSQIKSTHQKITMISAYDHWSAQLLAHTPIDCILVGDSAAMVLHGYSTTVPATMEMMVLHTQAVAKGAPNKFIVGDMPFCSYRKGLTQSMENVDQLMKAGAHSIKLEGADDNCPLISHIVKSGIPVMGHLGLTPQSVNVLGGFKVQGKTDNSAQKIIEQAKALEDAGCFALVLECIPYRLAQEITEILTIPTIGIGAGPFTNGQVLVLQDMLGLIPHTKPKFLKTYINGFEIMRDSIERFDSEVKNHAFPAIEEHCY